MTKIIPYYDKVGKEEESNWGFFTPNGDYISSNMGYMPANYAKHYCKGEEYEFLRETLVQRVVNHYRNSKSNFPSNKLIDPYQDSKLSKEELKLYKEWIMIDRGYGLQDSMYFMLQVLGFDYYWNYNGKKIITSELEPQVRFFYYDFMEWDIKVINRLKYNDNDFVKVDSLIDSDANKEAIKKLERLKRDIPFKDRTDYLKSL